MMDGRVRTVAGKQGKARNAQTIGIVAIPFCAGRAMTRNQSDLMTCALAAPVAAAVAVVAVGV